MNETTKKTLKGLARIAFPNLLIGDAIRTTKVPNLEDEIRDDENFEKAVRNREFNEKVENTAEAGSLIGYIAGAILAANTYLAGPIQEEITTVNENHTVVTTTYQDRETNLHGVIGGLIPGLGIADRLLSNEYETSQRQTHLINLDDVSSPRTMTFSYDGKTIDVEGRKLGYEDLTCQVPLDQNGNFGNIYVEKGEQTEAPVELHELIEASEDFTWFAKDTCKDIVKQYQSK